MAATPDRKKPAAEPGSDPTPGRSGGVEGGTILVGLILGAGLILMVLKLAGVLG